MQKPVKHMLLIKDGEKAGQQWLITADSISIGRGSECDLLLPDLQISRQHVRIDHEGEAFTLYDLESKNGTWVNGQPVRGPEGVVLHDRDEISLANAIRLVFVASDETLQSVVIDRDKPVAAETGLRIDRDARRVFVTGRELDPPLSLPQYRLLELLIDLRGGICSREQVITAVWPEAISEGVSEQAIDALVRRLRDRIAEFDSEHQYIVTVRGHGFRLDNPS